MFKYITFFAVLGLLSCTSEVDSENEALNDKNLDSLDVADDGSDTVKIISDYQMDNVDAKRQAEFKANLARIEKKHGIQWDFCDCIVANDSLDKAAKKANLSDAALDKLLTRWDFIEKKCQAFLVQNPNQTPEERARHEKKVRDCLKAAES